MAENEKVETKVQEGETATTTPIFLPEQKNTLFRSKKVLIGLVAAVLIIGSLVVYGIYQSQNSDKDKICSNSQLRSAARHINDKNTNELKRTTESIESTARYDRDINCVYITAQYYYLSNQYKPLMESITTMNDRRVDGNTLSTILSDDIDANIREFNMFIMDERDKANDIKFFYEGQDDIR